jgi:hypothetical protein
MTMRNRKTVITAFILVAVMLMAVGFAALTDNLIIAGEANSNTTKAQAQWEQDIYFSAAQAKSTTGTSGTADEASVGTSNNDHANYKVFSLARSGEKAVFVFTIKNDGNTGYAANITIDSGYPTNTNEEYYKVTYSYGASGTDYTVPAGGTLDVTVTVELIKDPDTNLNGQFTLNLTATSVET